MNGTSFEHASSCPRCWAVLAPCSSHCDGCGLAFARRGGVLDAIGDTLREARAAQVEALYTRHPFPGYAPSDDGPTLLDRSRRAPFLAALDRAVGPQTTVLDCGSGTAQLAA